MVDMTGAGDCLPDFDVEGLWERLSGDVEAMLTMLEMFQDEFPRRLTALRDGVGRGDLKEVSRCAHGIKGLCAGIGAERLRALMAAVEKEPSLADQGFFREVSAGFLRFAKASEELRRRWGR
ncbi:MAG: Hpt domain-containing protein [Thermanaerothrix sp.]|nr:Hpt domain-containing protein [Thermanaerothrix sp.]